MLHSYTVTLARRQLASRLFALQHALPDIWQWMIARDCRCANQTPLMCATDWLYQYKGNHPVHGHIYEFTFHDQETALLFKLTWGGA